MNVAPRREVSLLVAGLLLATWLAGWWGVALVAAGWGLRGRADGAALAGFMAWAALLAVQAVRGPVLPLAERLGALIQAPAWVALVLTPLFGGLLTWSAATVAAALRKGVRA